MTQIIDITSYACPKCKSKSIYKSPKFFRFSEMNDSCPTCDFKFDKEPGFFYGAMYLSYGLAVAQSIAAFFIAQLFFDETFDLRVIPVLILTILFFAPLNYKLSRVIWIYLFQKN